MREKEWYDKPWVEPTDEGALDLIKLSVENKDDPLDTIYITIDKKVKTCASCWWNSLEGGNTVCERTGEQKTGWFNHCPTWQGVILR